MKIEAQNLLSRIEKVGNLVGGWNKDSKKRLWGLSYENVRKWSVSIQIDLRMMQKFTASESKIRKRLRRRLKTWVHHCLFQFKSSFSLKYTSGEWYKWRILGWACWESLNIRSNRSEIVFGGCLGEIRRMENFFHQIGRIERDLCLDPSIDISSPSPDNKGPNPVVLSGRR